MNIIQIINETIATVLNEKLANVDDDVNLIYDTYFAKAIDEINRTGIVNSNMFVASETDSSIFKTDEAVAAHNLSPVNIYINNGGGNNYNPHSSIIQLNMNPSAISFVKNYNSISAAVAKLSDDKAHSLANEFTEEKIKGTIHHELAHWIDNVQHNNHIVNDLNKRKQLVANEKSVSDVNSTKFEIEGQIHNIKQLKNKYGNKWDKTTFNELVMISPTLGNIYRTLQGEEKIKWIRNLKTRMHREGLLGKNMINN